MTTYLTTNFAKNIAAARLQVAAAQADFKMFTPAKTQPVLVKTEKEAKPGKKSVDLELLLIII